jgi:hypothetical protein
MHQHANYTVIHWLAENVDRVADISAAQTLTREYLRKKYKGC